MMNADWDVVIVGGGPAGLSAGIYTSRAGLKTRIYESISPGGQILMTDSLENYPGFEEPIAGMELAERMAKQAQRCGAELVTGRVVDVQIHGEGMPFLIQTEEGAPQSCRALIIASGATPKRLGVPGEDAFWGKGVSVCATCDGFFYRGKRVVVVGGGYSAIQEAQYLARLVKELVLVHRRESLRARGGQVDQLLAMKDKVSVSWNSVIQEILGKDRVEGVVLRSTVDLGKTWTVPCDGVFLFIGLKPNTDWIRGKVDINEAGYVLADDLMRTSRKGIFVAGDVRETPQRQLVNACGDGAMAAYSVERYIDEIRGTTYPGR